MTVFNCYMKITRKNIGMIIMYFGIFIGISIAMLYATKESESTFMDAKLSAGIVDNDKSEISKYMIEYLSKLHNVEIMEDDTSVLQEKMYYNKEDIIIQIPKGFSDNFLTGGALVSVTQQDKKSLDQSLKLISDQQMVFSYYMILLVVILLNKYLVGSIQFMKLLGRPKIL